MAKRQDGNAVDVTAPEGGLTKDVPAYVDNFHGFPQDDADEGDTLALATDEAVYEFEVPAGVSAAIGALLYISTDGNHTISDAAAEGRVPFAKVTKAKDANNVVWAKQLPQSDSIVEEVSA